MVLNLLLHMIFLNSSPTIVDMFNTMFFRFSELFLPDFQVNSSDTSEEIIGFHLSCITLKPRLLCSYSLGNCLEQLYLTIHNILYNN